MSAACPHCSGAHTLSQCPTWRGIYGDGTVYANTQKDALIAAIHREESPGVLADLNAQLERLQAGRAEEYSVDQWWYKELLKAADQQGSSLDLRRAVIGVIPKMIESLSAQPEQAKPTAIALTDADVELLAAAKAFAKEHIEGDALHEDESSDWTLVQQSDERYNATKLALCNAYRRHLTAPHGESDKTVGDA